MVIWQPYFQDLSLETVSILCNKLAMTFVCLRLPVSRRGRGVPSVTRTEPRCPGVDEGEEGPSSERRTSQSSAGQTASGFRTVVQRPALRAPIRVLQPNGRRAEEGAAAEVTSPHYLLVSLCNGLTRMEDQWWSSTFTYFVLQFLRSNKKLGKSIQLTRLSFITSAKMTFCLWFSGVIWWKRTPCYAQKQWGRKKSRGREGSTTTHCSGSGCPMETSYKVLTTESCE